MKGVVLEIKNGYAAVLKQDGTVVKIRRKCNVGDTIEIPQTIRFARAIAIAAAVVLIILGASGGYYYTAMAASTVTIHSSDGDLTLSLNRLDRVIKVESAGSLREDTVQDLYAKGIRNCTLPEALEKAADILKETESQDEQRSFAIDIEAKTSGKYDSLKGQAEEKGFYTGNPEPNPEKKEDPERNPGNADSANGKNEVLPEETFSGNMPENQRSDTQVNPEQQGQLPEQQGQSSGQQSPDLQAAQDPQDQSLDPQGQSSEQQGPDILATPEQQGPDMQTMPEQQGPDMQIMPEQQGQSSEQPGPNMQSVPEEPGNHNLGQPAPSGEMQQSNQRP